jgi:predicted RNase H-like HicB family nuclease
MMSLVICEKSDTAWGAYSPDLPGLAAEGETPRDVKGLIKETMELRLDGARQNSDPIAITEYIPIDRHA